MGVPDDANPLNRRLPAEVVSRRRKVEKVEKEETPLATDRGQVLAMKAEHRLKWLSKALQKCHEGRIPVNTVFDIVTHAKFTSDTSDKLGSKMFRAVRANLSLFSSKQQRFLEGDECRLVEMFKRTLRGGGDAADTSAGVAAGSSGDVDAPAEAPPKDFAGIAALWARMTQLSPLERAEAVEQLDGSTKELLEDFLEARIKRAQEGSGGGDGAEDGAAGAAGADGQAQPLPQGSRSRSGGRSAGSRDGSRGRDGHGRSRSRSRSRAAEKGRKAARERSRSRSRSEGRGRQGGEAKGSKRNRDRDDDGRRGKKGKSRRGCSSSGRRGRSSSRSPS